MANPVAHVVVENQRFDAIPNSGARRTALDQVLEFNKSANGAYRVLQLIEKVSKAASLVLTELGSELSVYFTELAGKVGIASSFLAIPRLPDVTKKAWEALTTWGAVDGPEGYPLRGHVKSAHDVFDCSATWGYVLSLITNSTPVKNVADVFSFGSDVTGLSMAAEDYGVAGKYLEQIDSQQVELKERFEDTKKDALLRLAKEVISAVSGAIGLLVLAFGSPILPAPVLLTLSLTSLVFAMSSWFFRESRNYELVKFFEFRKPEVIVGGLRVN